LSRLPVIGITMGDPAGVGPEIIIKAFADESLHLVCTPVVLGDPQLLQDRMECTCRRLLLNIVDRASAAKATPGTMDVIDLSRMEGRVIPGRPTTEGGRAMVRYISEAVSLIRGGSIQAMVTCPINKALMHQAGYHYEGHTQMIAHLTDAKDYVMMLAGSRLRVALATIHVPLREVALVLKEETVLMTIRVTCEALQQDFGCRSPRLAVSALNPHGGESGLFGTEEETIIEPAVRRAREQGYPVVGPLPADTLFFKAASGQYDAVVAMYHDQGLVPLKLLHFSDAVNVTLGLPIVRTSVDHGTAYDIAGTGQADPSSLVAAIRLAAQIVANRNRLSGDSCEESRKRA
jgi:4-hydroxythreonine-4-phosphate dehydrogenase